MFRFPLCSVRNMIQLRKTLSPISCHSFLSNFCQNRLASAISSPDVRHLATQKKNADNKPARSIIEETFNSVSRKLKMPSLKPHYATIPNSGTLPWKTGLTLRWPETVSFEAEGRNKREAEELAAHKAFSYLLESNIISPSGKLLFQVSAHKTLHPESQSTLNFNNGPLPVDGVPVKNEDLEAVQQSFPNFKSTLINCFMKVSNHMKNANLIVRPAFNRVGKGVTSRWQATYTLKWPDHREFSGIANNRSEAEKWAILSALYWLTEKGHLHRDGFPILYSEEQLSEWKSTAKNPAAIKLSPEWTSALEGLVNDYKALKPRLAEDLAAYEREMTSNCIIPADEECLEEVEEERELEESLETSSASQVSDWSKEDLEGPIDSVTGRPCRALGPSELEDLNEKLFISAQRRIVEKVGPAIPYLPILEKREEILDLIQRSRVVVLSGDTGCGKSTQLPQYLLDSFALDHKGSDCNIIVTQPRRLAALSLAQTVAGHRGEKVGESIGYQVRLNSVMPRQPRGRVLFCSTGILLRRLQASPELSGVSHLIIDEVHERDCLTDFTLVIIKDLLKTNPSLKVILMSASLNADLLSRYFDSAPLIHVNGRTFPVKKHFLPEIQQLVKSSSSIKSTDVTRPFVDQEMIIKLIRHIDLNKPSEGAILCFLPGWADIKSLHSKLKEYYPSEETHWVLPVHSRLSQKEQERIFDRPPQGVRKIVLSTNIAETSLTINDVVYVIDPGIHKEMRYNTQRGSAIMENQWISKANVQQRAGRAGRVQPGESFHLYTQEKYEELDRFPLAEILRIPLEKVIMDIKAYDGNLKSVEFLSRALEPPSRRAIYSAIQELEEIGALDAGEQLTALGRRIALFSTHPRLSKALVYATLFRCLDPVASVVAGLTSSREGWSIDSSVGNARQILRLAKRRFHQTSDHLALANLLHQFSQQRGRQDVDNFCDQVKANPKALYFLKGVRSLLVGHLNEASLLSDSADAFDHDHPVNTNAGNDEMVKAALLMGLGDKVLRVRRGRIAKGILRSDELVISSEKHGQVQLVSDSVNYGGRIDGDFLMYFNGVYQLERRAFTVRDTSQLSRLTVLLAAGKSLSHYRDGDQSVLTVDNKSQLKFTCSTREAELLVGLRESLRDTCEYLLRTAGLRQASQLTPAVGQHHGRQIQLLSRMLTECGDNTTD